MLQQVHLELYPDESETDTDFVCEPCQAFAIGYREGALAQTIFESPCDQPGTEMQALLYDDVEISNGCELVRAGRIHRAALCSLHAKLYEGAALKQKCSMESCYFSGTKGDGGQLLCANHRADQALARDRTPSPQADSPVPASAPESSKRTRRTQKLTSRVLGLIMMEGKETPKSHSPFPIPAKPLAKARSESPTRKKRAPAALVSVSPNAKVQREPIADSLSYSPKAALQPLLAGHR